MLRANLRAKLGAQLCAKLQEPELKPKLRAEVRAAQSGTDYAKTESAEQFGKLPLSEGKS